MSDETPGTAVAVNQVELEVARAAILDDQPLPMSSDPEQASRDIAARVLEAATAEDVLGSQSLEAWSDLIDLPVTVRGFRLNPSTEANGPTVYAVVDLTDLVDGSDHKVACGGRNVLAQLLRLLELEAFPVTCKLISKRTGAGNDTLWLESV